MGGRSSAVVGKGRAMTADPAVPSPAPRDPVESEDAAAELVRMTVGMDDIVAGSLLFFLCDAQRRPSVPVLITDVPVTAPVGAVLDRWFDHLEGMLEGEGASLVFARARRGRSFVLDHDRPWHDAVVRGCRRTGIELVAAFVVTQHAVVPYPPPLAAVAP